MTFIRSKLITHALATGCLLAGLLPVQSLGAELAELIAGGQRSAALDLIRRGTDVNEAQPDGTTPLHWAVYNVDSELVDALLRAEAEANTRNRFGSSPLAEAINTGNAELAEKLLAAGADANYRNEDDQTALMLAANVRSAVIARALLAHGAEVNVSEKLTGQTALMWAAGLNAPDIVAMLVDAGADVSLRSYINDWPSQITTEPRAQYRPAAGLTPLHFAARSGCGSCVEVILSAGADIDLPTPEGVTPLIIAIESRNFDVAIQLLDAGANPHIWDWWGRTALYTAVDQNNGGNSTAGTSGTILGTPSGRRNGISAVDVARRLLDMGVNPDARLNFHRPGRGGGSGRFVDDLLTTGATPMLRAAIGFDNESIQLLLDYGADIELPNVMGVTPLIAAAGQGVSGRDPRGSYEDRDIQQKVISTLELLLANGADINRRITDISSHTALIARPSTMTDREGQTALFGAVKFAWAVVVQWLIDHGADVNINDTLGRSPLDAAEGRITGRDNTVSAEVADIIRRAMAEDA